MTRRMSVSLTEPQVRARTKNVTRRDGWRTLQPGPLVLVRKAMGLRKGEHQVVVDTVDVVSVTFERLDTITPAEVVAEGFPDMSPAEFVEFFCGSHRGVKPATVVTRIEWTYRCMVDGCDRPEVYLGLCLEHAEEDFGPANEDIGELIGWNPAINGFDRP